MSNPVQNLPIDIIEDSNAGVSKQHSNFISSIQNNTSYTHQYYATNSSMHPSQRIPQHSDYPQQRLQRSQQPYAANNALPNNNQSSHNDHNDVINQSFKRTEYGNYSQYQGHQQMYQVHEGNSHQIHDGSASFARQNISQKLYVQNQNQNVSYSPEHHQPQIHQIFHEEVVQTTPQEDHISMGNSNYQPYPRQNVYRQHQQQSHPMRTRYNMRQSYSPQSQSEGIERMDTSMPTTSKSDDFVDDYQDQHYHSYIVPQAEMYQSSTEHQYLPSVGSTCTIETSSSPTEPAEETDVYDFSPSNDDNETQLPTKAPSVFAMGISMPATYDPTPISISIQTSSNKIKGRSFSKAVPALEEEEEEELSPNRIISPTSKVSKAKVEESKSSSSTAEAEDESIMTRKRSRKQVLPSTKKPLSQPSSSATATTSKVMTKSAALTMKNLQPSTKSSPPTASTLSPKSSTIAKTSTLTSNLKNTNAKCTSPVTKTAAQTTKTATKNASPVAKNPSLVIKIIDPVPQSIPLSGKITTTKNTTAAKSTSKVSPSFKKEKEVKEDKKDLITKAKKVDAPRNSQVSSTMSSARRLTTQKEKEKEKDAANSSILGNILAASNVPPKIQTSKRSVMLSDNFMDALADQGPKKAKIVRKKVKSASAVITSDGVSKVTKNTADETSKPQTNAQRMAAIASLVPAPVDIAAGNEARRRIRFADEKGGELVQVRFFEVEEGERMNVSKMPREDMKHQEIQNERMQGERRGLHFKPTHLPMPQSFDFRQYGSATIFRPWRLIPVDGLPDLVEHGTNSESKTIETRRQNTVMEAFHDPFITLQMEEIDEADNQRDEFAPPPKIIPLEGCFTTHESLEISSPSATPSGWPSPKFQLSFSESASIYTSASTTQPSAVSSFAEAMSAAANMSRLSAILPPNVAALVSGTSSLPSAPASSSILASEKTAAEGLLSFSSPADALPFEKKLLAEKVESAVLKELDSPVSPVGDVKMDTKSDHAKDMDSETIKSPEGPESPDNVVLNRFVAESSDDVDMNEDDDKEDTDIRYIPIERPANKMEVDGSQPSTQNALSDINDFISKLRSSGIIDGTNLAPSILNKVKSSISSNTPIKPDPQEPKDNTPVQPDFSGVGAITEQRRGSFTTETAHLPMTMPTIPPVLNPPLGMNTSPSVFPRIPRPGPLFQRGSHGSPYNASRFPSNFNSPRFGQRPSSSGYGFYGSPVNFFPALPTTTGAASLLTTTAPFSTAASNTATTSINERSGNATTTTVSAGQFFGMNALNNRNNVVSAEINNGPITNAAHSVNLPLQPSFEHTSSISEPSTLGSHFNEVKPPGLGGSPPQLNAFLSGASLGENDSLENCDIEALMPIAKTFVKQCTYYMADGCSFGDMCHFAHDNIMTAGLRHAIAAVNAGHRPFSSASGYRGFHNRNVANVSTVGGGVELNYDKGTKKLRTVQIPPNYVMVSSVENDSNSGNEFPGFGASSSTRGGRGGSRRFVSPVRRGGFESRRFGGGRRRRTRSRSISPVRNASKRRSRSPRRPKSHRSIEKGNRRRSTSNSSASSKSSASNTSNQQPTASESTSNDKEGKGRNRDGSSPSAYRSRRYCSRSRSPLVDGRKYRQGGSGRHRNRSNMYNDMDDFSNRRRGRGGGNRHGGRNNAKKTDTSEELQQEPLFVRWANSPVEARESTQKTKESTKSSSKDGMEHISESGSRSRNIGVHGNVGADEGEITTV